MNSPQNAGRSLKALVTVESLTLHAEEALRDSVTQGGACVTLRTEQGRFRGCPRMFLIIGIVVVFGAVVAGYLMEHGNISVLLQPAELVIIRGAAIGTVLIANQLYILKAIAAGIAGAFGGSKFSKDRYLETLKMMYELFGRARKEGLMALETDSDAPDKSPVFSKYPKFLKDYHALPFVCDTIRMAAGGGVEPFDVDQMMELDMDVHHHDAAQPISALSTMADSLPGLGIVAALLIGENQVTQVRGFADQRLRIKDDPLDPSNRRISLIVQYTERKPAELSTGGEDGAKPQDDTTKPASNPGENSAPASHNKKALETPGDRSRISGSETEMCLGLDGKSNWPISPASQFGRNQCDTACCRCSRSCSPWSQFHRRSGNGATIQNGKCRRS